VPATVINKDKNDGPAERSSTTMSEEPRKFTCFSALTSELKSHLLRFVAEAPLETLPFPGSTLTHTLGLVNREFRQFANDDKPWRDALVRVCKKEPDLWIDAVASVAGMDAQEVAACKDTGVMVDRARARHHAGFKSLYRNIVNESLRWTGPIFFMPGVVGLGQTYGLHFFEPRYRLLIAEVMRGQPLEARNNGPIQIPAYFVHANHGPLEPTIPAVMVQVVKCRIYPDGRADVLLLPVRYVWIERVWARPNSGQLFEGQCLKMGKAATREMVELHRRQALAHIMDQLAHQLNDATESGNDQASDSETLDDER
jgi:hypothetical protein